MAVKKIIPLIGKIPPRILILNILMFVVLFTQNLYSQLEPENILLKDYQPKNIFNIPESIIKEAKFPIIDIHTHPYIKTAEQVAQWVESMDEAGIEKVIVLTQSYGARFDSLFILYSQYPGRFDLWCGFDYTGYDEPGYGPAAIAELERCFKVGAKGVGELGDKGSGMMFCKPTAPGMHFDDPRMDPLLKKCGELGMPINIHVGEPLWFYLPMDSTNDGMMNAYKWRLDNKEGILGWKEVVQTLENAVAKHTNTTFVACHLANCNHDLAILGDLLDKHPNLYADISARYELFATIPRYAANFFIKYQDRLMYGTDMFPSLEMYKNTIRILETDDEHFYDSRYKYHWPLYGLGLPDEVLLKIYRGNALEIIERN